MTGLALSRISKRFGAVRALREVELEVAEGELLVVLGPSGCGKTTLLRIVAGLERPDEGLVAIRGRDVTALSPGARNVSMVFQGSALFPHLTAAGNIGFGLAVREVPREERRARVAWAAQLTGLTDALERYPAELSGGERQRVALARAIVREPDAFLLDEPLSNLDAELRAQMRVELRRLHDEIGATMLYVTHDQVEALTLGDRIAVLREGAIEQAGTPDELWHEPANSFVARFVGSPGMNVVPPAALGLEGVAGERRVEVGVRPEHLALGQEGVDATVALVEPLGSDALVHLRTAGTELRARVPLDGRPAAGDVVHVSAARDQLHLFDAETGKRIPWT